MQFKHKLKEIIFKYNIQIYNNTIIVYKSKSLVWHSLTPNSTVLNKRYGSLVTTSIDTEVIGLFVTFIADFWANLDQRFFGY